MERQQINISTVGQAMKDGTLANWDLESLQVAIGVVTASCSSAFDATRVMNDCETIRTIIRSKEATAGKREFLEELGRHHSTSKDGVFWAKIASVAAIAAFLVALVDLIVRLLQQH